MVTSPHAYSSPSGSQTNQITGLSQSDNPVSVDRPSLLRRCLPIAVPVLAFAGAAVSYALASGVNGNNYDQGATYQPERQNLLIGAAGLVGGALLPPLAACGRRVVRALCERGVQVAPDPRSPASMEEGRAGQASKPGVLVWELPGIAGRRPAASPEVGQRGASEIAEQDFAPTPDRLTRSHRGLGLTLES